MNPYETWSEACLKMEQRERLNADTPVKPSTFGPEMKLLYLDGNSMDESSMRLSPEAESSPPAAVPTAAEEAQASPSVADIAAKFMRELQANNSAPPRPSGQPGRVSPCIDAVRQQYLGCASPAEGMAATTGGGKSPRPPLALKDVNVPSPFAPVSNCQTARPPQAEVAKLTMPAPLPRPRAPLLPASPAGIPSSLYRAPVSAMSMSTTDETATQHVQSPKRIPVYAASPATLESPFESGDRGASSFAAAAAANDDDAGTDAAAFQHAPSEEAGYESPGPTSRLNDSRNGSGYISGQDVLGSSEQLCHSSGGGGGVSAWPSSPDQGSDARANLFGSPQPHMHMRRAVRNAQWLKSPELPSAADSSQNCSLDLLNSLASPTPRGAAPDNASPQAPASEKRALSIAAAPTDGVAVDVYINAAPEITSAQTVALVSGSNANASLDSSSEESRLEPSLSAVSSGQAATEPTIVAASAAAAISAPSAYRSPEGQVALLSAGPVVAAPPMTPAMQPSAACPAQLVESQKSSVAGGSGIAATCGSIIAAPVLPAFAANAAAVPNTVQHPAMTHGTAKNFGSPALATGGGVHAVAALSTTPAMCATLATELSPQWDFNMSDSSFSLLSSSPAQPPSSSRQQQQQQQQQLSPAVSSPSTLSPMPSLSADKNMNFQQRFAALRALAQSRGVSSPEAQNTATAAAAAAVDGTKAHDVAAEEAQAAEEAKAAAEATAAEEARAAAEAQEREQQAKIAAAEAQAVAEARVAAEARAAAQEAATKEAEAAAKKAEAAAAAAYEKEKEERARAAAAAEAQALAQAEAARLASESEAWAKEQARKRAARHRADEGSLSPAAVSAAASQQAAEEKKAEEAERKAKEEVEKKEAHEAELREVAAAAAAAESVRLQKERDEQAAAAAQKLREEQEKIAAAEAERALKEKEAHEAELREVAAAAAAAESARLQKERDEQAAAGAAAQKLREEQEKIATAPTDVGEVPSVSAVTSVLVPPEEETAGTTAALEIDSVADAAEHALVVEHAHILAQAQQARQVVRDNAARRAAVEDKKRALRERQAAAAASAQRAVRAAAEEVRAREARAAAAVRATAAAEAAAAAKAAVARAQEAEAEELEARRGAEEEVEELERRARAAADLRMAAAAVDGAAAAAATTVGNTPDVTAPQITARDVASSTNTGVPTTVTAVSELKEHTQSPSSGAREVSNEDTVLVPVGLDPDVAAEYAALAKAAARFQELKSYLAQHELQASARNQAPDVVTQDEATGSATARAGKKSGILAAKAMEQRIAMSATDPSAALESSTLTFDVANDERGNGGMCAEIVSTTNKQNAVMPTILSPTPEPSEVIAAAVQEPTIDDEHNDHAAATERSASLCLGYFGNGARAMSSSACGSESLSISGASSSERARVANLVRDVIRSSPAAASRGRSKNCMINKKKPLPHPQERSGSRLHGKEEKVKGQGGAGVLSLAPGASAPAVAYDNDYDAEDTVLMGDTAAMDELETSAYWNLAENDNDHNNLEGGEAAANLLSPRATAAVFSTPGGGASSANRRRPPPHTPPMTDLTKAAFADDEWTFAAPSPQPQLELEQDEGTDSGSYNGPRKNYHSSSARLFEEAEAPCVHPVATSGPGGGGSGADSSWFAVPPLPPTPSVLEPPRGKRCAPKGRHHKAAAAAAARAPSVAATSVTSATGTDAAATIENPEVNQDVREAPEAAVDRQHGVSGASPRRPAFRGKTLAALEKRAPRRIAEGTAGTSPSQRAVQPSPEKQQQDPNQQQQKQEPQPSHEVSSRNRRRRLESPRPRAGGGMVDEQSETLATSAVHAVKEVSNMAVVGSPTSHDIAAAEAAALAESFSTDVKAPACYDDGALQLVCHAGDFAETRLELTNGSNGYLELAAHVDPHETVQQRQLQQHGHRGQQLEQGQEQEQQTSFFVVAFIGGETPPPLLCNQREEDVTNESTAAAEGISGREKGSSNNSNTSSTLRLAPGGKAALVVRFVPKPSANPAVLAATLHLSRRPVGSPSISSSAVVKTTEKAQTSALRLQGTVVGAPCVKLSCPDHQGLAWTAPMPTTAAAAASSSSSSVALPSSFRRVQVRNDGVDPCVVECEVLGGGATFAVHDMVVTDVVPGNTGRHACAALPPPSSISAATKVPRVSLAVGATATIMVSCAGFDQAAASNPNVASSSDTAVSAVGPLANEVTAVLLVRASPDLDVIMFGSSSRLEPRSTKKPRAGSAHLADGTVPRAHAMPLRLKAAGLIASGAPQECENAHLAETSFSGAKDTAAEGAVGRCHHQPPSPRNAPTLELTPRHLELVESAGALEGWLALRLKPDDDNDNGDNAGPVAFTVCCPHPKMVVHPSQGLLRRRSCLGGRHRDNTGGAVDESGDGTVWVQVCISLDDVSGLRCTALEIEMGPGGQRRCVPIRLPAVVPTKALAAAPEAAGDDGDHCDGVYFKGAMVNFGRVPVGELRDLTLRLCNANAAQAASVHLDHPGLPFVLRHHMVTVRPRAYVKVPLRFAPCVRGDFEVVLAARRANGSVICQVTLVGTAV